MAARIHPDWRVANEATAYPFAADATLRSANGRTIPEGTFLDAAVYPLGRGPDFYLSSVAASSQQVVLTIGDSASPNVASGAFDPANLPDRVELIDANGRPAGILVSEARRLAVLSAFTGTVPFSAAATPFCASVSFPAPIAGVAAFVLPDGSRATGEVWLVGGAGVVVLPGGSTGDSASTSDSDSADAGPLCAPLNVGLDAPGDHEIVYVHVVGDPLFRRELCGNAGFVTPRFLKQLHFVTSLATFDVGPGPHGAVRFGVDEALAADVALRIGTDGGALTFSVIGPSP